MSVCLYKEVSGGMKCGVDYYLRWLLWATGRRKPDVWHMLSSMCAFIIECAMLTLKNKINTKSSGDILRSCHVVTGMLMKLTLHLSKN